MSRKIHVGRVAIGGGSPIVIQSMCNTRTDDPAASLAQIGRLAALGCQVIRLALPNQNAVPGFSEICAKSPLPVIADIHFDYRLALAALQAGADGIRVNPGNIRDISKVREVAAAAAAAGKAVRVGVNLGSLSPAAEAQFGRNWEAMVASVQEYLRIFEEAGCEDLKVSLKASDLKTTVAACRRFRELSDWPLHLGVTEAGTPAQGIVKSAVGIGALLLDGIGDTIRVSLTAPPEDEIPAACRILDALGLRPGRPQLVSCPTCGRTRVNLIGMAEAVEAEIDRILAAGFAIPLRKIAVMGCEVNGPGEAADADLGIAGGACQGLLFKHGKAVKSFPENELVPAIISEIRQAAGINE